jgi:uncharacterized RDD family membrane protein YckC
MACPRCGDVCRCDPETRFARTRPRFQPRFEPDAEGEAQGVATHEVWIDPEALDTSEQQFAASLEGSPLPSHRPRFVADSQQVGAPAVQHLAESGDRVNGLEGAEPADTSVPQCAEVSEQVFGDLQAAATAGVSAKTEAPEPVGTESWRREVAARLNRYHSRRKPRAPRYPSLRLKFEASENGWTDSSRISESPTHTSPLATHSLSASAASARTMSQVLSARREPSEVAASLAVTEIEPILPAAPAPADLIGNLIEFPRWNAAPPVRLEELADPVMGRPRIIEAPEVAPPPPALGGILMESVPEPEIAKQPGIDVPLQSASLERRLLATATDSVVVAAALALFGYVFLRVSTPKLPLLQMAEVGAAVAGVLWAAYQYLFLVHTGSTPGLRLTRLQLCRFDGSAANRRIRRWRVLVSLLSAASLGLGYAWYFLDEGALCWHDRITHTYLGPMPRPSAEKS